jgi:hypothetical protein
MDRTHARDNHAQGGEVTVENAADAAIDEHTDALSRVERRALKVLIRP